MSSGLHPVLKSRGITDFDTGSNAAEQHFESFLQKVLGLAAGPISAYTIGLLAMATRAQAFHHGALRMLRADDPFSAYALTRSYAENAAALVWATHRPDKAAGLAALASREQKLVVGRLIDEAKKHYPGFKQLYEALSEYTHPVSSTFGAAFHKSGVADFQWSSVPKFKSDEGPLWVLLWLMELTDLHVALWPRLYQDAVERMVKDDS